VMCCRGVIRCGRTASHGSDTWRIGRGG
jgi:hypothetical protein